MIYAVTFNPALDVSGVVDELIPNEKCYVHDEIHTPGGNGINAGIIAHRLKSNVIMTGFLGGANGDEIKRLLDREEVSHHFVKIKAKTRMNISVLNKDDHRQTRLSFPGPSILKIESESLRSLLQRVTADDIVILGGSFTPCLDVTYAQRLIRNLRRRGIRCLVDMPGEYLKDIMNAKPDFIKPNLVEFQKLVGKKVRTIKEVLPIAKEFLDSVPLICISSVEGGALLINKDETWYGRIPPVKIHSTVGAGDSMVGAMASLWDQKLDVSVEELLRMGLASSCATLTERGLILGSRKSILKYRSKIFLKRL